MIEIPDHEVIVQNAVFAQPTPDFSSKYITVINFYKQSRPSDTWDYILKKAEGAVFAKDVGIEPQTEIEKLISKLPDDILNNLAGQREKFYDYLISDTQEGFNSLTYLEICYGTLPIETLAKGNGDPYWYVRLMQELMPDEEDEMLNHYMEGELMHVAILYENGELPALDEISQLAKHITSESRTLNVFPNQYNPDELMSIVKKVYTGLKQGSLNELRVIDELNEYAASALREVLIDIKGENFMEENYEHDSPDLP